jgi:hypothetical protein
MEKNRFIPRSEYLTGPEILVNLDAPALITHLKGGDVQIEKAGIIGNGPTITHAVAMWGRKLSDMLATITVLEGSEPVKHLMRLPAFA